MRYLVLIVVYKRNLLKCETIGSIISSKDYLQDSKIIIWDNSPISAEKHEINLVRKKSLNIEYNHTPENIPLSKIYNHVLGSLDINKYDFLVIFDQDTTFSSLFFKRANESIKANPNINLFLPIVISKSHIVSPASLYYFKGFYWKQKRSGLIKSKYKTAINSGMIISTNYLKNKFKYYDEKLKFYGTDNYFMKKYAKDNPFLYIFDYEITHDLALFNNEDIEIKLRRHKENVNATLVLNNECLLLRILARIYVTAYSFKEVLKRRNIRFIYDK